MKRYRAAVCVLPLLAVLAPLGANAAERIEDGVAQQQPAPQDAGDPGPVQVLEDVVVTAERRTTSLQRTAIAATVLTGQDLERRGVGSVDDLQFAAPSVTVQNFGQGNQFNVRGIGKAANGNAISVGVVTYRDGVATFPGYFQSEPYYDIANLEVLRGPQGTFAGQNATGGAVFITQANPNFSGVRGYGQVQVGNYNNVRAQGALNLPVSDTLALRLAFNSERRDSFYTITGAYTGNPGRLEGDSVRASLLWRPIDALRILVKADYNDIDRGGYIADPVNSTSPLFEVGNNAPNKARDVFGRLVFDISYAFDNGLTLRSLTGYQRGKTEAGGDLDGTATLSNVYLFNAEERVFSQEFTLSSPANGPLGWIVGVYYQDDWVNFPAGEFYQGSPRGVLDTTLEGTNVRETSAAFGQISYQLTDSLQLQVGGRYTRATTRNDGVTRIIQLGRVTYQNDFTEMEKFTGKVALNWQVNPANFVYAFVATGVKAGGLNAPNTLGTPRAFEAETVTDYELGWKANWFNGRLRTQVGGYYNRYENFQVQIADPDNPSLSPFMNVPTPSTIYGVEASAQARFGDFWVDAAVALSRTELGDFFAADPRRPRVGTCNLATGPATASCLDLSGNEQPYAPRFTGNIGVQYDFHLGDFTLSPRVDYAHIDEAWATIFANPALYDRLEARDIVNAQLTLRNDDWTATLYGTNLTDLEYVAAVNARQQRFAGPPRQYGVRLTRSF